VNYLDESHILLFLLQLLALLGVARTLGVACKACNIPALAGEIATGILLGPTILGRVAPTLQHGLFPDEVIQVTMLDTVAWLGVFFLLLAVGFEVDISRAVFRQGKSALAVGVVGVLIPVILGFAVFWHVDPHYWGPKATRVSFTLFLAVAASITAISVVARVVRDLDMLGSDLGTLILSACAVNDVFGWVLFTFAVALASGGQTDYRHGLVALIGVVIFVGLCLSIGGYLLRHAARRVKETQLPDTPALLTLVTSVGLVCGIITHWLGIHAILGFFLAGVMVGSIEEEIKHEQRASLADTVYGIFVPVFFATIGIKIDFLAYLDLSFTALFCLVAMGGKLVGAWAGARLSSQTPHASEMIGIAFVPGGAMEIVVGILAVDLGLVSQETFVAIVFTALLSSVLVGPLMAYRVERDDLARASNGDQEPVDDPWPEGGGTASTGQGEDSSSDRETLPTNSS
jgi:Kef-type K+ transport system membrane component KefB